MNSGSIQSENFLDRESSLGVLLMLPGLILLAVFLAYPFFLGIWLSLTDTRIGMPGEFIGLWNYVDLLEDEIFLLMDSFLLEQEYYQLQFLLVSNYEVFEFLEYVV